VTRMGSVTKPRGRLPRRVYWVRRGVVLGAALLLVFGIGKFLGGNGADAPGTAVQAGSGTATQATTSARSSVTLGPVAPSTKLRAQTKVPLLPPSGDCTADEVSVLPQVPKAWAGTPVAILLQLQGTQPACTFKVSPESLVVKIVSGADRIWSSQDCPKSVPTTTVVVRSGTPVAVPVIWSGRRSDATCSDAPGWAYPGFYHVYAAALGSTPTDVQFEVTHAAPKLVTRTPRPHPSGSPTVGQPTTKASPRSSATPTPTHKPTHKASTRP
jgi:hypothetical protein